MSTCLKTSFWPQSTKGTLHFSRNRCSSAPGRELKSARFASQKRIMASRPMGGLGNIKRQPSGNSRMSSPVMCPFFGGNLFGRRLDDFFEDFLDVMVISRSSVHSWFCLRRLHDFRRQLVARPAVVRE